MYPLLLCKSQSLNYTVADANAKPSGAVERARIIQNYYYLLVHNFAKYLEPLAAKLFSLGVVNIDSVDTTNQPKKKRASVLLDAIIANVKSDGKLFDTLVTGLHDIPEVNFLGDELETALKIQVAERNIDVIVIHPTQVNRGISSPAAPNSENSQQETTSSTSKFELEFPTIAMMRQLELIVDNEPVIHLL